MQHGIKRRLWSQELRRKKKEEDKKKIECYNSLVKKVIDFKNQKLYTRETLILSAELLDLNPEFNTIWNFRRDIILALKGQLDDKFWENELKYTLIQLKKFPKVYWIWSYRIWILEEIPQSPIKIWENEFLIVNTLLKMDSRNFHGWHYRRMIVTKLEKLTKTNLNTHEFEYVTEKINKDISNYSSWHQRVHIINSMFLNDQIKNKKSFVENEIDYLTNAIYTDSEDQSVWFYLKWFIKNEHVAKTLKDAKYNAFLESLKENVQAINLDDVEFSGKESVWCLKMLIEIEELQLSRGLNIEQHSKQYLEKLINVDPLRENRYKYLLSNL